MAETQYEEIRRLNFEDLLWVMFILLTILDIYADRKQKEYLISNNIKDAKTAKRAYATILLLTVLIYMYFMARNYYFLISNNNPKQKKMDLIHFLGSLALVGGSIMLLYYQVNNKINEGSLIF